MTGRGHWVFLALLPLLVPLLAGKAVGDELAGPYVIRSTPELAYIDAGSDQGTRLGQVFVLVRQLPRGVVHVADVRVIRLYPAFAIAEVLHVEAGLQVRILDRAVPLSQWEESSLREDRSGVAGGRERAPRRDVGMYLLGGAEWSRRGDGLEWEDGLLKDAEDGGGAAGGVRLYAVVSRRYRLNLTGHVGFGQDVTSWAADLGLHFAPRGWEMAGPYVGAGVGVQRLDWDAPPLVPGSSTKLGVQLVVGLVIPGPLDVLLETGYQRVGHWQHRVDVSHVRTYLGLGRSF